MRKSTRRRSAAILGALVVAGFTRDADAFCRKTTCRDCPLDPVTGCPSGGEPLKWARPCISYSLSRAGSKKVTIPEVTAAAAEAFRAWQIVSCPGSGGSPSITATEAFGLTGCNFHEYTKNGVNVNVILFHDDEWPYPESEDAVGLTSSTYDEHTGDIFDADIEINSTVDLSAAEVVPPDKYDLLSVLTHEVGHFLGLAHSNEAGSVMNPIYEIGSQDFRVLGDDDTAGICAIYPPGQASAPCDFTPRGGFASECALGVTSGGCGVAAGPATESPAALIAGFSAVCVVGVRRSRKDARGAPRRRSSR